jgi:competence protein ComFC
MEWKPVLNGVRTAWDGFLDLVYPPRCLICERYDSPVVCDSCYAAFTPIPEPTCAVCGHPVQETSPCRNCDAAEESGGWGFVLARAAGIYEGPLRAGIHALKYNRCELLGPALGTHLANRCLADELLPRSVQKSLHGVLPVPIHSSRQRKRGYNQARLLAAPVAEMLGVPLLPETLLRIRKTQSQVELSAAGRRKNLQPEYFAVPNSGLIQGKNLLLIDDVMTTGTTASVCAAALRNAGAAQIYVVTLAAGG